MPPEYSGLYYDAEKNRYFLNRNRNLSQYVALPKPTTTPKAVEPCIRSRVRLSKLLKVRELSGNSVYSSKGRKCNFNEEFRKMQASHPKVWKYRDTEKLGVSALERVHLNVQLREGETLTAALLTGGKNGNLSLSEVGKLRPQFVYRDQSIPARKWPINKDNQTTCRGCPGNIRHIEETSVNLSSTVTSIKLFRKADNIQHALISTLGSEGSRGKLYALNLTKSIRELHRFSIDLMQRSTQVASLACTIWTADCYSNQNRAAVGTNLGAALVDIETGVKSWVLRSKSDVLQQQFVHSGNAIICGLRNGAIVTVDVREKQLGSSTSLGNRTQLVKHKISYMQKDCTVGKSSTRWCKISGNIQPSQTISLPSSISSLVALQFDDQYFLASSMDGTIKLYDHRLVQRGPVQSYEGHVNSHTRIQLGVDPLERFVMSGGEDSHLRLWSIRSGELLFQEKLSDTILSTVCWRGEERPMLVTKDVSKHNETKSAGDFGDYFNENRYGTGAWLGSDEGLFYFDCS